MWSHQRVLEFLSWPCVRCSLLFLMRLFVSPTTTQRSMLTQVFISTGAPFALSSLGSVPSGSTAQRIVSFYKYIQDDRMDKAHVPYVAQLEVANIIGCPQPWYWATFTLMGGLEVKEVRRKDLMAEYHKKGNTWHKPLPWLSVS